MSNVIFGRRHYFIVYRQGQLEGVHLVLASGSGDINFGLYRNQVQIFSLGFRDFCAAGCLGTVLLEFSFAR